MSPNLHAVGKDDERKLHRYGDSYAHVSGLTKRHFIPVIGHFFESILGMIGFGTDPDDPYQNPEAFIRMSMDAYDSNVAITGKAKYSREDFKAMIEGVTKLESPVDQKNYMKNTFGITSSNEEYGLLGLSKLKRIVTGKQDEY